MILLCGQFFFSVQQFKPIIGFGAFFQRNFQLADKISPALSISGLMDICTDGRGTTQKLVKETEQPWIPSQMSETVMAKSILSSRSWFLFSTMFVSPFCRYVCLWQTRYVDIVHSIYCQAIRYVALGRQGRYKSLLAPQGISSACTYRTRSVYRKSRQGFISSRQASMVEIVSVVSSSTSSRTLMVSRAVNNVTLCSVAI